MKEKIRKFQAIIRLWIQRWNAWQNANSGIMGVVYLFFGATALWYSMRGFMYLVLFFGGVLLVQQGFSLVDFQRIGNFLDAISSKLKRNKDKNARVFQQTDSKREKMDSWSSQE